MTTKLLANQLRSILNDPVEGFTVEADEANFFEWKVWIEGPKDTCYEGGVFQLALKFPKDYPMAPPELKFVSDFWHPNVFANGKVCMSILHPPGEDAMSGELPEERWLPTQSVTTIILSLLSLLNDPNCASPANVDASVEWQSSRYIQK
jgi:ubiquitin-conjugating enzyme E2 R